MDAQYRRGFGGTGGGHIGRGGRGQFRDWGGGFGGEISANRDWRHSHRGFGQQHGNGNQTHLEIPEDEVDPLKLFVGNLRQNVNKDQLLATLTPHANVTSAFIVKKSIGANYAFVRLPTEDDVKKIMDLNYENCYLSGSKLIFRSARRHFIPPGEQGFVRQSLPDRDYDLSHLDPNKPSIHILVDDVMMKIFEYLPIKERVLCEIVCRRWQALLYVMFERTTHLYLNQTYRNEQYIYISKYDKAMLSKMLLLAGETLKSLTLSDFNDSMMNKLFFIIAQLCPNLEYLHLSNVTIYYFDYVIDLKKCKNLKGFSVKKCPKFNDKLFLELITVLQCLEKINISETPIKGRFFHLLPNGLKELNISFCRQISKENLRKISKAYKYLEVLQMENIDVDKEFLEELGVNCTNLRCIKLSPRHNVEVSNQVKVFTKLTSLTISASIFELLNIADNVKHLEELHIRIGQKTTNMVDFGKFTQLKKVVIICSPFRKQELMSLGKCRNLQYVTILQCNDVDQETIKNIVKGCPQIKHIACPKVHSNIEFINDINEIMTNQSEPIRISVNKGVLTTKELLEAQYDTKKIHFDFTQEYILMWKLQR